MLMSLIPYREHTHLTSIFKFSLKKDMNWGISDTTADEVKKIF